MTLLYVSFKEASRFVLTDQECLSVRCTCPVVIMQVPAPAGNRPSHGGACAAVNTAQAFVTCGLSVLTQDIRQVKIWHRSQTWRYVLQKSQPVDQVTLAL